MATKSYQPPRTGFGGQGQRKASPKNETAKKVGNSSPTIQPKSVPTATFYNPKAQAVLSANGTGAPTDVAGNNGGASSIGNVQTNYSGAMGTGPSAGMGYTDVGRQIAYQNPLSVAMQVNPNYGMATMLSDYFQPLLYQHFINSQGMGNQSDEAILDYIISGMQQATTPGAASPDFAAMMDTILGATDPSQGALAMDLSGVDPVTQVKRMEEYLQAAGYGNNPLAQRAYGNANDYFGAQYLSGASTGQPAASNYASFLASSPLAKWYGG